MSSVGENDNHVNDYETTGIINIQSQSVEQLLEQEIDEVYINDSVYNSKETIENNSVHNSQNDFNSSSELFNNKSYLVNDRNVKQNKFNNFSKIPNEMPKKEMPEGLLCEKNYSSVPEIISTTKEDLEHHWKFTDYCNETLNSYFSNGKHLEIYKEELDLDDIEESNTEVNRLAYKDNLSEINNHKKRHFNNIPSNFENYSYTNDAQQASFFF